MMPSVTDLPLFVSFPPIYLLARISLHPSLSTSLIPSFDFNFSDLFLLLLSISFISMAEILNRRTRMNACKRMDKNEEVSHDHHFSS